MCGTMAFIIQKCSCDIFPLAIWNGHQAFYLLWKASKPAASDLGPLVCTVIVRFVQWLPLVCDAFGFVALCSVVAVRKNIQEKFDSSHVRKPVPYVLSSVQNELKKCPSFNFFAIIIIIIMCFFEDTSQSLTLFIMCIQGKFLIFGSIEWLMLT